MSKIAFGIFALVAAALGALAMKATMPERVKLVETQVVVRKPAPPPEVIKVREPVIVRVPAPAPPAVVNLLQPWPWLDYESRIQFALNVIGVPEHTPLAVDGIRGTKTDAAIRAFQRSEGLAVDGKVGAKTRAAIAHDLLTRPAPAAAD